MNNLINQRAKRQARVQKKLLSHSTLPRLVVNRSNNHIFAQLLERKTGKVICSYGSQNLTDAKGTKIEIATQVGTALAELIKAKKISQVVFDRGSYKFHGRVKALAESIKKMGINL